MKHQTFSFLRAAAVTAAGLVLASAALALVEPGSVTVLVDGLRSDAGAVEINLYSSEEAWARGDALQSARIEANQAPVRAVFSELPAGEYAIRVFHDVDGDGQLDLNRMGVPAERYGFSNEARPRFRAARHDEAAFTLEPGEARTEEISLQGAMGQ